MPTSRDVARLAGVSQSTVSYVMSGKRPISEAVRKRVEDAIAQLTYQPNAGARALASQQTHVIGLVVPFGPSADTTGLLPFIETITSGARERDYDVLLVTADEGPSALTRLEGRSLCDAIVLMEIEARDPRIPVASGLRVPVILIGVPDDPAGLPCVDVDFAAAARAAVTEHVRDGCHRIVVLGHPAEVIDRDINYARRFIASATATAAELGVPCSVVAPVEPTPAGAEAAVAEALADGREGLGVVVAGSSAVQPVLTALERGGCVLGRDVAVIGMCTDAAAVGAQPPVSNVSLEPRDVSRRALQTLFRRLDPERAGEPAEVELVAPRLTHRATTRGTPQAREVVAS